LFGSEPIRYRCGVVKSWSSRGGDSCGKSAALEITPKRKRRISGERKPQTWKRREMKQKSEPAAVAIEPTNGKL
jgi:hypothetical protein